MTREKAFEVLDKLPRCQECDGLFPYSCNECDDAFFKAFEALKQPEIVRCKDCKWHDNADDSPKYLPCMEMRTNPNWFCADGERK